MRCEGDQRLPSRNASLSVSRGTAGLLRRTGRVRLTFLLPVVAATASACGAGSPASPTFTPTTTSVSEEAGPSLPDGASTEQIAEVFGRCGTSPATGTFPPDVAAIITSRCQPCHQMPPLNGAPFPLLTYEDVHQLVPGSATPIYEEMYILTQPNGSPHMPFGNAQQLTEDQLATLGSWLLSCAPPAD
jgi:uncharacterized membrane protein